MKAILISVKPKWVAKILNGEKTIEIRKTMPKCDLPIDVYIYCTKDKPYLAHATELFTGKYGCISNDEVSYKEHNLNGKVVAKFTLNKVEEIETCERHNPELLTQSCLNANEFYDYLIKGKNFLGRVLGYAWHIDNLVIFDEPKELSEFKQPRDSYGKVNWNANEYYYMELTKAPQSWCYVEELL